MLKTLALAFALAAGTVASVPAFAFNPQPDPPGDVWADYAQIKIPDDVVRDGDFSEFAANAHPVDGALQGLVAAGDDWEHRV
jgi:hypothetical protein